MQWEFVGRQELKSPDRTIMGQYVYETFLWRTLVPGGWLLMALNSRSNSPDPIVSFYPDPTHSWRPNAPPESGYLLRATTSADAEASGELLRANQDDDLDPKLLES